MKKSVFALFMAVIMILAPQTVCFAENKGNDSAAGVSSSNLSPNIIADSYSVDRKNIQGGDTFKLSFNLKNTSRDIDIRNILIRLSGGEVFSANNSTDTLYSDKIAKGGSAAFSKSFYCSETAESGMYPVTASVTYEYFDDGEKISASSEFSFSVKVIKKSETVTEAPSASLTPQILISEFSYGGAEINGGAEFDLNFKIKNNADRIAVKNIIVKLSGGETFVVADGTDTVSVKSLSGGASAGITKSFKCLNSALSGVYPITASISYEYYDGGEKVAGTSELTMSVPVIQPDKIEFQSIELADKTVTVDQENDCAFQLVNSGQTRLANGKVRLLDESGNELVSAFIGNIEPGTQFSSNYTLPVTFNKTGAQTLTLVFEYDNENMEKKAIEQQFRVNVEEYFDPFEDLTEEEQITEEGGANIAGIIIGVAAGIAVIVIAAVVIKKVVKKRKAKKGSEIFDEEI